MKFALIGFNCRFTHSCLSLFYLRQELLKNIDDVYININQFTINDPYYSTLMQISSLKADALFFSVYIWNGGIIKRIINDLAKIKPFSRFILGGPQAIAFRADDLPANSTVISGEIEGIDPSFYVDLKCGSLGTSYQGARSKKFDSPFTEDDFGDQLADRHIYFESSRGCPYSHHWNQVSATKIWKRSAMNSERSSPINHKVFVLSTEHSTPQIKELWKSGNFFGIDPRGPLSILKFLQISFQRRCFCFFKQ